MEGEFHKIFSCSLFLLKVRSRVIATNRFAIIIPGRVVPKSARRHFFKRIFTNSVAMWPDMGRDFIFIGSAQLGKFSREDVKREIGRALQTIQKYGTNI